MIQTFVIDCQTQGVRVPNKIQVNTQRLQNNYHLFIYYDSTYYDASNLKYEICIITEM